jgi:hypothetical protein
VRGARTFTCCTCARVRERITSPISLTVPTMFIKPKSIDRFGHAATITWPDSCIRYGYGRAVMLNGRQAEVTSFHDRCAHASPGHEDNVHTCTPCAPLVCAHALPPFAAATVTVNVHVCVPLLCAHVAFMHAVQADHTPTQLTKPRQSAHTNAIS